jgi:hypothetical protein
MALFKPLNMLVGTLAPNWKPVIQISIVLLLLCGEIHDTFSDCPIIVTLTNNINDIIQNPSTYWLIPLPPDGIQTCWCSPPLAIQLVN